MNELTAPHSARPVRGAESLCDILLARAVHGDRLADRPCPGTVLRGNLDDPRAPAIDELAREYVERFAPEGRRSGGGPLGYRVSTSIQWSLGSTK